MRFVDIVEIEEEKHKERLRIKKIEAENKCLKQILIESGIAIPETSSLLEESWQTSNAPSS